MCIIVSKEKGKSIPKKSTLQACFENNRDGAGFMYYYDNGVIIEKGFMDFDSFYKRVKNLDKKINLKKRSVVFHFRISTSGKIDKSTCHPYPITNKVEHLKNTSLKCKIGMVHNGILSNFVVPQYSNKDNLNDTQNFVKTFIYNLYKLNKSFLTNEFGKNLIENEIGTSRLCFITSDDKIHYFGNFIEDNGIKYSNSNYKPKEKFTSNVSSVWREWWNNRYNNYWDFDEYEDFDKKTENTKKTQTNKKTNTEHYELTENEVVFLNATIMYNSPVEGYNYYYADSTLCVDADYNLYKKIATHVKDGKNVYTLKLMACEVDLYDKFYNYLPFESLQKGGV